MAVSKEEKEILFGPLNINPTKSVPEVIMDAQNGIFEISGNSRMENVSLFYKPIMKWLDEYTKSPNSSTVFEFRISYFNTASALIIFDLMKKLEKIPNITIRWYYPSNDVDLLEAGEDYATVIKVPIEVIAFEDEYDLDILKT